MVKVLVERLRIFLLLDDVEIDVGGIAPAELGDDHRRADQPFFPVVGEHEHVLAFLGVFDLAGKAALRQIDDLANGLAIVGKVDGVEVTGHVEELLFVGPFDTANLVSGHDLFKWRNRWTVRRRRRGGRGPRPVLFSAGSRCAAVQ